MDWRLDARRLPENMDPDLRKTRSGKNKAHSSSLVRFESVQILSYPMHALRRSPEPDTLDTVLGDEFSPLAARGGEHPGTSVALGRALGLFRPRNRLIRCLIVIRNTMIPCIAPPSAFACVYTSHTCQRPRQNLDLQFRSQISL